MLHSFNCIEYPIVFLALNRLGAICCPTSPLFNAHELHDQVVVGQVRHLLYCSCSYAPPSTHHEPLDRWTRNRQGKAIITHKALADVAIEGAKLSGIDASLVFAMGPSPADVGLVAIEYVLLFLPWH